MRYSLIAPIVKPLTKYFCTAIPAINIGAQAITVAAEPPPQLIDTWEMKPDIHTGIVLVVASDKIIENINSFQEYIVVNIPVATNPDVLRGNAITMNDSNLEHPSIIAACSSASGKSSKKLRIIQIVNGRFRVAWVKMMAM
jgi:hypothetical protein